MEKRKSRIQFEHMKHRAEPMPYEEAMAGFIPFGWENDAAEGKIRVRVMNDGGKAKLMMVPAETLTSPCGR